MGIYDSVMAPCPACAHPLEFQSKAGECDLAVYHLTDGVTDAPPEVAGDLHGYYQVCQCGRAVEMRAEVRLAVVLVEKRPEPEPSAPAPRRSAAQSAVWEVEALWQQWGEWPFSMTPRPGDPLPSQLRLEYWWRGKARPYRSPLSGSAEEQLALRVEDLAASRDWAVAREGWSSDAELVKVVKETELLFRAHFPDRAGLAAAGSVSGPLFPKEES